MPTTQANPREIKPPYELVMPDEGESFRVNKYRNRPVILPTPDSAQSSRKCIIAPFAVPFAEQVERIFQAREQEIYEELEQRRAFHSALNPQVDPTKKQIRWL